MAHLTAMLYTIRVRYDICKLQFVVRLARDRIGFLSQQQTFVSAFLLAVDDNYQFADQQSIRVCSLISLRNELPPAALHHHGTAPKETHVPTLSQPRKDPPDARTQTRVSPQRLPLRQVHADSTEQESERGSSGEQKTRSQSKETGR